MTNEVEKVDLELKLLKTHPQQSQLFTQTNQAQLDELAADLERRGQQESIHLTRDHTIIRGHRRVAQRLKC